MDERDTIAAYLREQLWPKQPGFGYAPEMCAEIDRRCGELADGILERLGRPAAAPTAGQEG